MGRCCLLNSHCIRKSITAMFISSPRDLNSCFREPARKHCTWGSRQKSRESSTRKKTRVRGAGKKWELATISHEFSFHLGNRRKPQSVKTVTGNKKCVSRLSVTCIGHEPVTLAFQEQDITITITKTRLPEEDNWSGHSDLDRSL